LAGYVDSIREGMETRVKRMLDQFIEKSGRFYVCPICFNDRSVDDGRLVPNAELKGATPLMEFVGDGATTFTDLTLAVRRQEITIPVGALVVLLCALGVVAGVWPAVLPACRAVRRNVLEALAYAPRRVLTPPSCGGGRRAGAAFEQALDRPHAEGRAEEVALCEVAPEPA
jgi:hypothetical protein